MESFWKRSFRRVSDDSPETLRSLRVSTKFQHRELGEISVFYEVYALDMGQGIQEWNK